jgi:hypothetical protein
MGHGVPGAAPQTAKREWFSRLIGGGASSVEACRIATRTRPTHGEAVAAAELRARRGHPLAEILR